MTKANIIKGKIRNISIALAFLFVLPSAQAQSEISDSLFFKKYLSLETEGTYFTTDKLQNIYLVDLRNDLIKYNSKGEEQFRFNNNFLGTLSHVDATDPFNLLLYYPEYLTIVSLDRTLNKTGTFSLYDLDVVTVKAVGMSNDNNIWIYDDVVFKLKKVNRAGDVLIESDNINALVAEEVELEPDFILERDNWVYVNVPESGILVFDNFGQYAKTLPFKGLKEFQVMEDQIIFLEEGKLKLYHLKSLFTKVLDLPGTLSEDIQVRIQKELLFIRREGNLEVFSF